jgi:rRNA processing protein Krr1/Pno1
VTEVQNYGSEGVKAVIGRGGGTIQAIQVATGAKIDANVEQGTVTLTGAREAVEEARTLCYNAVHGEAQDEIELGSRNAVNVVFGKGFVRIREIQDATECKLDIQRGSTKLKLSGSQEAVASARKTVEELLELNRGIEMMIDGSRVGAVYGKSGATLRSIQEKTGAFIEVDRNGDTATCSIMGPPEVVQRAKTLVQKAIDGEVELKPGEILESIDLGIATPAVIGKGGSRVAELEKEHSVKVNVDSTTSTCKIMGPAKNVAAAKEAIEAIAKPLLDAQAAMKEADRAVDAGDSAWAGGALDPDAEGW